MVSAVFHAPLTAVAEGSAIQSGASTADFTRDTHQKPTKPHPAKAHSTGFDWRGMLLQVVPPLCGIALLVGIWALVSVGTAASIPSPLETWKQAVVLFSDPFYSKGPNDQGLGWNVLFSLERVALGFGLAAAVGIPVGFMIGRFEFLSRMFNPLIS
ncbi:MAG: ABC transporter permease, partial [Rhodoferax sp.]